MYGLGLRSITHAQTNDTGFSPIPTGEQNSNSWSTIPVSLFRFFSHRPKVLMHMFTNLLKLNGHGANTRGM